MPDRSSATAEFPASALTTFTVRTTKDDTTDRDAATPTELAGVFFNKILNELEAVQNYAIAVTGLYVTDNGGLDVAFSAGRIRVGDGAPIDVAASTLTLADDDTSYVECDAAGAVSDNIVGFTDGSLPMATVVTASGDISSITDDRCGYYLFSAADAGVLLADGTVPLTANWDAGAFEIRAATFESDVTTGTAPFTIASTTVSTNLNADLLDAKHSTSFVLCDGTSSPHTRG